MSTMNLVRKRLKLIPSKSRPAASSYDALLLPPVPAGGGMEEEGGGYLLVEEDTTDSSLFITMGNTCTHLWGQLGLPTTVLVLSFSPHRVQVSRHKWARNTRSP